MNIPQTNRVLEACSQIYFVSIFCLPEYQSDGSAGPIMINTNQKMPLEPSPRLLQKYHMDDNMDYKV